MSSSSRWSHWDGRRTRRYFVNVLTLLVFCFLSIFVGQHMFSSTSMKLPSPKLYDERKNAKNWYDSDLPVEILNISAEMLNFLEQQRKLIKTELTAAKVVHNSLYGNMHIDDYANFVPQNGGIPIRSIIVSTWRSGSTFMGDLLNAIPANFYHYEPLLYYDIIQIRGPPLADEALQVLKNLLQCNYAPLNEYLEYGRSHQWLFTHNERLWNLCSTKKNICWMPEFLTPMCKLFPFQSMKVVRVRLSLMRNLLTDSTLNIKIIYLVRDPRGTLRSRKHHPWCPGNPDCELPEILCTDLISDFKAAKRMEHEYPDRFRVIRYEDLSENSVSISKSLFKFLGFEFHPAVVKFLDTHTKTNNSGIFSTIRDSKFVPYQWRKDLPFEEINHIQNTCERAMQLWGYKMVSNETELLNFNPVLSKFEFSNIR